METLSIVVLKLVDATVHPDRFVWYESTHHAEGEIFFQRTRKSVQFRVSSTKEVHAIEKTDAFVTFQSLGHCVSIDSLGQTKIVPVSSLSSSDRKRAESACSISSAFPIILENIQDEHLQIQTDSIHTILSETLRIRSLEVKGELLTNRKSCHVHQLTVTGSLTNEGVILSASCTLIHATFTNQGILSTKTAKLDCPVFTNKGKLSVTETTNGRLGAYTNVGTIEWQGCVDVSIENMHNHSICNMVGSVCIRHGVNTELAQFRCSNMKVAAHFINKGQLWFAAISGEHGTLQNSGAMNGTASRLSIRSFINSEDARLTCEEDLCFSGDSFVNEDKAVIRARDIQFTGRTVTVTNNGEMIARVIKVDLKHGTFTNHDRIRSDKLMIENCAEYTNAPLATLEVATKCSAHVVCFRNCGIARFGGDTHLKTREFEQEGVLTVSGTLSCHSIRCHNLRGSISVQDVTFDSMADINLTGANVSAKGRATLRCHSIQADPKSSIICERDIHLRATESVRNSGKIESKLGMDMKGNALMNDGSILCPSLCVWSFETQVVNSGTIQHPLQLETNVFTNNVKGRVDNKGKQSTTCIKWMNHGDIAGHDVVIKATEFENRGSIGTHNLSIESQRSMDLYGTVVTKTTAKIVAYRSLSLTVHGRLDIGERMIFECSSTSGVLRVDEKATIIAGKGVDIVARSTYIYGTLTAGGESKIVSEFENHGTCDFHSLSFDGTKLDNYSTEHREGKLTIERFQHSPILWQLHNLLPRLESKTGIPEIVMVPFPILTIRNGSLDMQTITNEGVLNMEHAVLTLFYLKQTKHAKAVLGKILGSMNFNLLFTGSFIIRSLTTEEMLKSVYFVDCDATIVSGNFCTDKWHISSSKVTLGSGIYRVKSLEITESTTLTFACGPHATIEISEKFENLGTIASQTNLELICLDRKDTGKPTITDPTLFVSNIEHKTLEQIRPGTLCAKANLVVRLPPYADMALGVLVRFRDRWTCGGTIKLYGKLFLMTLDIKIPSRLELYVDEFSNPQYELSCLSLVLQCKSFKLGTDNTKMGSISTLGGQLSISTDSAELDLRFAKLYGNGATTITAPGKLLIGARKTNTHSIHKDPVTGTVYPYTRNASFIKSGSHINIDAHDVEISYGTVYSELYIIWDVKNLFRNIAGFVTSELFMDVNASTFEHKRDSVFNSPVGNWTPYYHSCYNQRHSSDAAILQVLRGSIYFRIHSGIIHSTVVRAASAIHYYDAKAGFLNTVKPASLQILSTTLGSYGCHHRQGYHRGSNNWVSPSVVMSGEAIHVSSNWGELKMTTSGTMSAPTISIEVKDLEVWNPSRLGSSSTVNTKTKSTTIFDLSKIGEEYSSITSMYRVLPAHHKCLIEMNTPEIKRPFTSPPPPRSCLLGSNVCAEHIQLLPARGANTHIPLLMSPSVLKFALFEGLARLGSLHLGLAKGDDLLTQLHTNAHDYVSDADMSDNVSVLISRKPVEKAMLLYQQQMVGLRQLETVSHQLAYAAHLILPPNTPSHTYSPGSILAEKELKIRTSGDSRFKSSLLVGGDSIDIKSKGSATRETILHSWHYEQNGHSVFENKAGAHETMISHGNIHIMGHSGYTEKGATTVSTGGNIIKGSVQGNVTIQPVVETRISAQHYKTGNVLFGSSESSVTTTTHTILPSVSVAKGDHVIRAGGSREIQLVGSSVTSGRDLLISGGHLAASGFAVVDTVERSGSEDDGWLNRAVGGGNTSNRSRAETLNVSKGQIAAGRDIILSTDTASFRGVEAKWGQTLSDRTVNLHVGPLEYDTRSHTEESAQKTGICFTGGSHASGCIQINQHHVIPSRWCGGKAEFGSEEKKGSLTLVSTEMDIQQSVIKKDVVQHAAKASVTRSESYTGQRWGLISCPALPKLACTIQNITDGGQYINSVFATGRAVNGFLQGTGDTIYQFGRVFGTSSYTRTRRESTLCWEHDVPNRISWGDTIFDRSHLHIKGHNAFKTVRGSLKEWTSEPVAEVLHYRLQSSVNSMTANPFTLSFSHAKGETEGWSSYIRRDPSLFYVEEDVDLHCESVHATGLAVVGNKDFKLQVSGDLYGSSCYDANDESWHTHHLHLGVSLAPLAGSNYMCSAHTLAGSGYTSSLTQKYHATVGVGSRRAGIFVRGSADVRMEGTRHCMSFPITSLSGNVNVEAQVHREGDMPSILMEYEVHKESPAEWKRIALFGNAILTACELNDNIYGCFPRQRMCGAHTITPRKGSQSQSQRQEVQVNVQDRINQEKRVVHRNVCTRKKSRIARNRNPDQPKKSWTSDAGDVLVYSVGQETPKSHYLDKDPLTRQYLLETMGDLEVLAIPVRVAEATTSFVVQSGSKAIRYACSHPRIRPGCQYTKRAFESGCAVVMDWMDRRMPTKLKEMPSKVYALYDQLATTSFGAKLRNAYGRLQRVPQEWEHKYDIPALRTKSAYSDALSVGMMGGGVFYRKALVTSRVPALSKKEIVSSLLESIDGANVCAKHILHPTVREAKTVRLGKGTLQFSPFPIESTKTADRSLMVYVHWLGYDRPSGISRYIGQKVKTEASSGLCHRALSTLKEYARKQGAGELRVQFYPDNSKLYELMERRFPYLGSWTSQGSHNNPLIERYVGTLPVFRIPLETEAKPVVLMTKYLSQLNKDIHLSIELKQLSNQTMLAHLEAIENLKESGTYLFQTMHRLERMAKASGSKQLVVEWQSENPRLTQILSRRYPYFGSSTKDYLADPTQYNFYKQPIHQIRINLE